ncbi:MULTISPECIES: hypothetical protein [unclassified Xanthobacter]|uniref:hypothetical protein n=1 Tax=unclassified Xanthobacter TaxID=2623496 RepID=UPI001EDCF1A7|nr:MULTISPECIES: hypothetical protein [unclassified Xanthobacter]
MIRFLLRFSGFWLLAGGFVALIVDGTRSIAASAMLFTSAGDAWYALAPGNIEHAEAVTEAASPLLWSKLVMPLLSLPASAVLVVAGLALLGLGRSREHSRFEVS